MEQSSIMTALPVHATGATVACLIVGAGAFLAIGPALASQNEDVVTEDLVAGRVAETARLGGDLRSMTIRRDAIQTRLEDGGIALDPPARLGDRLGTLAMFAEQHGVLIDEMAPGQTRVHELCQIIDIRMRVRGTPSAVTGLLNTIAQSDRGLSVRSLDLQTEPGSAASEAPGTTLVATIDIDWYAARQATAPNG